MPGLSLRALFQRSTRAGVLSPEQMATRAQWLEVVLLPVLAIGLGWWASPEDPTLSSVRFPWLWFAPVLIALRYGVLPGLVATVFLILNWLLANHLGRVAGDFSPDLFFGQGLLVLVCGEFSDVWRDRNKRVDETSLYVTERLSRLTKRHLLLNLSHDRLEQEMLARPGSLRDALARLRAIGIEKSQAGDAMPGAPALLHLLAQYVNIESAALYALNPQVGAYTLGSQIAQLGEPQTLAPDDELLRLALEQGSLAHIANKEASMQRQSNQLVVAPLIAGTDTLVGVLAVTLMPFYALNVENLQMMSVILAYYADNIHSATEVKQIQTRLPILPALYAEELVRMTLLQKKVGITSHIVVMTFGGTKNQEIVSDFLRIKRGLDLYWQTHVNGKWLVAVLMPFASSAATSGFLERVDAWLLSRHEGNFDSLGIHVRTIDFSFEDPVSALVGLVQE